MRPYTTLLDADGITVSENDWEAIRLIHYILRTYAITMGPAVVNAIERGEINLAYFGLPPAIKMKMNEMIRTCFRMSRI